MNDELEKYLNKDGTISARKVRRSVGSRRARKEGTKACRKPGSKKVLKATSGMCIKQKRNEVKNMFLQSLVPPTFQEQQ